MSSTTVRGGQFFWLIGVVGDITVRLSDDKFFSTILHLFDLIFEKLFTFFKNRLFLKTVFKEVMKYLILIIRSVFLRELFCLAYFFKIVFIFYVFILYFTLTLFFIKFLHAL